jgi:hypothetical protein
VLWLIELSKANLDLYALSLDDTGSRASFEAAAREAFSSFSDNETLPYIIDTSLGNDDEKEIRDKLKNKVDAQICLIQSGLLEHDRAKLRSILKLNGCAV